jgi:hypothetical protein
VDELLGSGGVTPSPTAALEPAYRPPAVPGGLPVTVPAPPVWEEAAWILEAVAVGCPWPDGDVDGVRRLRDAALAMGHVVREVATDVAGHSRRVTGSGDGPATAAFASASRVVHGPGGLVADLATRCDRLAGYCDDGAWRCRSGRGGYGRCRRTAMSAPAATVRDLPELFDVEVDHVAWGGVLIAPGALAVSADLLSGQRVTGGQQRHVVPAQDPGDGPGRHSGHSCDLVRSGPQFTPGGQHPFLGLGRGAARAAGGAAGAIVQTVPALVGEPFHPPVRALP